MSFRTRLAEKKDLEEIIKIIANYSGYDSRYAIRYYRRYFDAGDLETRRDKVFVATLGGKIVGVIGLFRDFYESDRSYWMGWFCVHKDYRRKGVGKMLLRRIENELRKKAVKKLFVNTGSAETYTDAMNFYFSNGFRLEGILRDYYSEGEDQIILSKDLKK